MSKRFISKKMLFITFLGSFFILLAIFFAKSPVNNAEWQVQYDLLPTVELANDTIRINNLRDFRYNDDGSVAQVRYIDQDYALSEFTSAWFGLSHFGKHGLAHALMSFEFADNKFLVVSIEARLQEKDVEGYNPIKGLFRAYAYFCERGHRLLRSVDTCTSPSNGGVSLAQSVHA